MELLTRLDDIQEQLEKSWPLTLEKTLKEFPHKNEDFYIFTYTKWEYHMLDINTGMLVPREEPRFNVIHIPCVHLFKSWFLPGTTMRKISPQRGCVEILWTLPEQDFFHLYQSGKIFADPIVNESIRKYLSGEFKDEESYKSI